MADETRGFLVPRITEIMTVLSSVCPPYVYPVDNSGNRVETLVPGGWVRGGTSADGSAEGDVTQANYFIGEKYLAKNYGAPQRIVWLLPKPGEERYVMPDSAGHHKHLEQVGGGENVPLQNGRPTIAYRKLMTRVCPVEADLWCNDYDDGDLLAHWLASVVEATDGSQASAVRERAVYSGGYVPEESGQRGVRYRLKCNFIFPVIAPFEQGGSYELKKPSSVTMDVNQVDAGKLNQAAMQAAFQQQIAMRTGTWQQTDLDVSPWRSNPLTQIGWKNTPPEKPLPTPPAGGVDEQGRVVGLTDEDQDSND